MPRYGLDIAIFNMIRYIVPSLVMDITRHTKVLGNERSWDRILMRMTVAGNESSRAISFQGVKNPGSKRATERKG